MNPAERSSAQEALGHAWLKSSITSSVHLTVGAEFKKFNAKKKWKSAMGATRGIVRMKMLSGTFASANGEVIPLPMSEGVLSECASRDERAEDKDIIDDGLAVDVEKEKEIDHDVVMSPNEVTLKVE